MIIGPVANSFCIIAGSLLGALCGPVISAELRQKFIVCRFFRLRRHHHAGSGSASDGLAQPPLVSMLPALLVMPLSAVMKALL